MTSSDAGRSELRDEAAEILRDSEERVAQAAAGEAPRDAADENRRSDEGVQP
jgi:hypothetical protein